MLNTAMRHGFHLGASSVCVRGKGVEGGGDWKEGWVIHSRNKLGMKIVMCMYVYTCRYIYTYTRHRCACVCVEGGGGGGGGGGGVK